MLKPSGLKLFMVANLCYHSVDDITLPWVCQIIWNSPSNDFTCILFIIE